MNEFVLPIITLLAGGGFGWLITINATKRKAEADAFKDVQDIYQQTIEDQKTIYLDLRKYTEELRADRDDIKKDRDEMRKRNSELETKVRELQDSVDELRREVAELRGESKIKEVEDAEDID